MGAAIRFENLSKLYRLGEVGTGTLAHDINRWWYRFRGKEDPYTKVGTTNDRTAKSTSDFAWALKDIDFSIAQGEVVGVIGRNGAGKSTLLKILSRVTAPTAGRVRVKGRLASLLEVGTGFHPELSGRDNIFLNGAILGMRKNEIARKLDEIVDFSGCERYINTPVKRYSSGMYVRLAFAVAAHLEPEILVVDEVLAVGDAEFQNKCIGKMQDITNKSQRTIVFVSHNMAAVRALCHRAVILEKGQLTFVGPTGEGIDRYLSSGSSNQMDIKWDETDAPGDEVLKLLRVRVVSHGRQNDIVALEEDAKIEIEYQVQKSHPRVCVSIHVNMQGTCAFVGGNSSTSHSPGVYCATTTIPGRLLNTGLYSVSAFLITNTTELRVVERDVVTFNVEETEKRGEYLGDVIGVVRPQLDWELVKVD